MSTSSKVPSLMVRLQVLAAIDYAQGNTIRDRIRAISPQRVIDPETGQHHQFTWCTIETWRCRYNKHGMTQLDKKTRSDKNTPRKVQIAEVAEAIHEVLPLLSLNKVGTNSKEHTLSLLIGAQRLHSSTNRTQHVYSVCA